MTALNPFNLSTKNWLSDDGEGGDDAGDNVTLGNHNILTGDKGHEGNATRVENSANLNFTLGGLNHATGTFAVGVFGESDGHDGAGVGVLGACDAGWGVAGVASVPSIDPTTGLPAKIGVFGVGDNVGIYGQSRFTENQAPGPVDLQPEIGTGVYGIGDNVGVDGASDGDGGCGVVGRSVRAKGVLGRSDKAADIGVFGESLADPIKSFVPVSPGTGVFGWGDLIGVYGQRIADPTKAAPLDSPGTGIFGRGDLIGVKGSSDTGRGGVFTTGAPPAQPLVAQVQLVPVTLPFADIEVRGAPAATLSVQLPKNGQAGDMLAVLAPVSFAVPPPPPSARLWFCIQSGTSAAAATWAEIAFDRTVVGSV